MKKNVLSITKLIFRIWKDGYTENPVVTYYEVIHGVSAKVKTILEIVLPAAILNTIVSKTAIWGVLGLCILYAISNTVLSLLERSSKLMQEAQGFKSVNLFLNKVNKKAMEVDYKDTESPESLDKMQTAKDAVWEFVDVGYVIFNDILGGMLSFAVMSYLFWSLNPWVFPVTLVLSVISTWIERKKEAANHKYHKEESAIRRGLAYCSGLLQNQKLGKEVRGYQASGFLRTKHHAEQHKHVTALEVMNNTLMRLSLLQKSMVFLQLIVVYILAVVEYSQGGLAIGSFLLYIGASVEFFAIITEMFDNYVELSSVVEYYEDYLEYMNLQETMLSTKGIATVAYTNESVFEFRNVSFTYPNQTLKVLKGINLTIQAGQRIAVLGENGSGKSTLIKLLLRLYDPTEGEILFNGIPIKSYDYREYLRLFSSVFQDYKMFAYTIRENICFDDDDEQRLEKVLAEVELEDVIKKARNGPDTFLGKDFTENGVNLSGGELQKIALARGFYRNGYIAVFDESTAALDPIQESRLYARINKFTEGRTAVFISHRMGSTAFCDNIYVLDGGKIVDEGTHAELLANKGQYYNMYQTQARYYTHTNP